MQTRKKTIVVLTLLLCLFGVLVPKPAYAAVGINDVLNNEKIKSTVKEIATELGNKGYSDSAKLALLANINQESAFNVGVVNHINCIGLFQYCFGRKDNLVKKYPNWKNSVKDQVAFMDEELPKTQIFTTDPKTSPNMNGYPENMRKKYATVDELKKESDYKVLLNVWLTMWEVPCAGYQGCAKEREHREGFAEELKKHWKEIFGTDFQGGSNSTSGSSNSGCVDNRQGIGTTREEQSSSTSENKPVCSGGSIGEAYGMPKVVNLADGQVKLELPNKESLTPDELFTTQALKEVRENDKSVTQSSYIAIGLGVIGILLMVWSVIITVAYLYDKGAGGLGGGFSLTKLVTLGRVNVLEEDQKTDGRAGAKTTVMVGSLFGLGVMVLSGAIFKIAEWVLNTIWEILKLLVN